MSGPDGKPTQGERLACAAILAKFGRDATLAEVAAVTAKEWFSTRGVGRHKVRAVRKMLQAAGRDMPGMAEYNAERGWPVFRDIAQPTQGGT